MIDMIKRKTVYSHRAKTPYLDRVIEEHIFSSTLIRIIYNTKSQGNLSQGSLNTAIIVIAECVLGPLIWDCIAK